MKLSFSYLLLFAGKGIPIVFDPRKLIQRHTHDQARMLQTYEIGILSVDSRIVIVSGPLRSVISPQAALACSDVVDPK